MADESQVSQALVALVSQIAYPTGTANPSLVGRPVRVYRGWPVPASLDADLKANKVNVSVYPTDTERRTTRYMPEWRTVGIAAPTLTLAASGTTLTVGGTATPGQNACAVANGTAYIYPVQAGDTPTTVATGLASLIAADTPVTSTGGTITVPQAHALTGRVGTMGTSIREIRRQKRTFQLIFWCANPQVRDDIASAVDLALADIDYLALPDGSSGRLLYEKSHTDDSSQKEGLYRRDLFYSVEYATTQTRQDATVVATAVNLRDFATNPLPAPQATLAWDLGRWDDGISSWTTPPATAWDTGFWDDGVSAWTAGATTAWDFGSWDDGISTWPPPPVTTWDSGRWDDAPSVWLGSAAWDGGTSWDGATAWLGANTWEAGSWDTSLQWDS